MQTPARNFALLTIRARQTTKAQPLNPAISTLEQPQQLPDSNHLRQRFRSRFQGAQAGIQAAGGFGGCRCPGETA